jgi:hypothetical protein
MGAPSITIDKAMDLVVKDTKEGRVNHLVPAVQIGENGQAFKPKATEVAHGGAPELLVTTPPPAPAGAGSGSGSANPNPPSGGPGGGSGSAAVTGGQVDNTGVTTTLHTTGSPADKTQPVPGAGGAPTGGGAGSAQRLVPKTGSGGHAR